MILIRTGLDRADWKFLREVCCLTGNAGDPLPDRARWEFFGEQWIGPYEKLRPEWSFVAEEKERRLGYLTGCPDTEAFERERRWLFDLPLDLKIRLGEFAATVDTQRFLTRFEGSFRRVPPDPGPETVFHLRQGREVSARIRAEYPAHLHMNLVADARGKGVGRRLVEAYRTALLARGVHGIHLYCGPKPRPFYEQLGFRCLDEIEFKAGIPIYRLGLRF